MVHEPSRVSSDTPEIIHPNAEVAKQTAQARKAHAELRKSRDHWITIGLAIDSFRRQLHAELRLNDPVPANPGHRYKLSMGAYLRKEGFHESCDGGFTKAERVNLQHVIDHLSEVESYITTLDPGARNKHNNPKVIWSGFLKSPRGKKYKKVKKVEPTPPNDSDTIWVGVRDGDEEDYLVFEKQDEAERYKDSYEDTPESHCIVRLAPASNFDFAGVIVSDDGVWEDARRKPAGSGDAIQTGAREKKSKNQ
jgi:hypothetical protein